MSLRGSLLFLLLVLCVNRPTALYAQQTETSATLLKWEQHIQNFMLDRSHNYGGTHFNRGLFREHLNTMSPEHEIDLLTYRYTLIDDYRWVQADQMYRTSVGSLNATDFSTENHVKSNIPIAGEGLFSFTGYHEENLRSNRFLFYIGYEHSVAEDHTVGGTHTLTSEKSDLDATIYYRYGSFENGMIQVDLTFMDWASNVVQSLARESSNEYNDLYEITHQYRTKPYLWSLNVISPQTKNLKAELLAGLQSYSEKLVQPSNDTTDFIDEEWAHYLGGLVEYSNEYLTAGVTYQRTFSKLKRRPAPGSTFENDFGNWQISDIGGIYVSGKVKNFGLEQWLWYESNTDRLQGDRVPGDISPSWANFRRIPFDFSENRLKMKSRINYNPVENGVITGLEFHADYRYLQGEETDGVRNYDFRRVYSIVRNRGERLTYTIGYRFSENFYFLAGISYDIDKDRQSGIGRERATGTPTWFDGGFGRLSISW